MVVTALKTLSEIDAGDRPLVGGKAYNCARLLQAGFPVPDGLAVPRDATEAELRALPNDAWFTRLPPESLFAVRSSGVGEDSAGHSFAGVHETQLNVHRRELLEAVLVCRRSAHSAQAAAYRQARQLPDEDAAMGVLVQQMVPAVVSGVAFTINPVTGADEIVVNAAWGLGDALVSGRVNPDEFILRKADGSLASSRRGTPDTESSKAALDAAQLGELGSLLLRIERYYGAPQDVEWCHDGRQFWIVQSRPVTSRQSAVRSPVPSSRLPVPTSVDVQWTRANLAEVLPEHTSPQALAALEEMLNAAERKFMGRLMAPESELGPIMKSFHGRMYINLSQMRHVMRLSGTAPADMMRSLGHPEQIGPEDEVRTRPRIRDIVRRLPDILRLMASDLGAARLVRRHEAETQAALARLAVDPRTLPDAAIAETFEWWHAAATDVMQIVFVMTNVLFRERLLRDICEKVGFPYERLVYPQLAAGARSVSTEQAFDLVRLADTARHEPRAAAYFSASGHSFRAFREMLAGTAFLARFDQFLARYGHRGRYESDWALPRLHEDPTPVLFAIGEQLRGQPQDLRAVAERQEADAAAAMGAFAARLTVWQRWTLLPVVRAVLRRLKKQYAWREQVRSDLTRVVSALRGWHLAVADRFVERGWIDQRDDYFFLLLPEIGAALRDGSRGAALRATVAKRRAELAEQQRIEMPMLMRESELPAILRLGRRGMAGDGGPAIADGLRGELTGLCVSPGAVEADVVVMKDPSEFAAMRRGAILVARATDPSWTPLFTLASGVIVEVGGMLSHASTIAREYGLPALANVKDATRILRTGDRVRLDASGGRVTLTPGETPGAY
jgi:rifampicin phosphotransferase